MNRRVLVAGLVAAALLACKKSSSGPGFGLGQPSSIAVFWGYGHLHPATRWPYAALANSQRDELVLFDAVNDAVVPAPILIRPLSIPEPFPRPSIVAAAEIAAPDSGDLAHPTPARPSLLVAVAAGSTQLQLVRTWLDGHLSDPSLSDEAPVELGSPVLAMIAVPTGPDHARVIAALADESLAVVDYEWSGDPAQAAQGAANKITRVGGEGAPPTVRPLGFQALSLAVDPQEAPPRYLYAATIDPIPASNAFGVAMFDMTGDPGAWPGPTAIKAGPGEGVPTRLVAALTLRERVAGPEGAYDQISNPDATGSSFEPGAVRRIYAWRDPSSCGPKTDVVCGIAVLDPVSGELARPAFLGGDNFPITIPSRPVALVAVKPPGFVDGAANTLELPNELTIVDAGGSRLTGGVLTIPAENGFVYVADLSRWEVPSSEAVADGGLHSTGVESLAPSASGARRIGLYRPAAVKQADEANHVNRADWMFSSGAASYVITTPGFTPSDAWTLTYQGYLPDFAASRIADVEQVPGQAGIYRVALQSHMAGSDTAFAQFYDVFDGAHGVRVGDIVEFWTGPTPVVDVRTGTLCPDTTTVQGDGLPTPAIEGKVLSVEPSDPAHPGGSLLVRKGDCVTVLRGTRTEVDCTRHGPWNDENGNSRCWDALPTLQASAESRAGSLPVRIRAGGGIEGEEEFVVAGAATGYAGRAVAGSSVPSALTFTFTSESEGQLSQDASTCTSDCRAVQEALAIARRARRTHLTSVACPPSSSSASYCQTYFGQFDRKEPDRVTDKATFPVPSGPTLGFSVGLMCVEGTTGCATGQGTTRALVRDAQISFHTRSGWSPAVRYGGGANGGAGTQPTGATAFDRSSPEWGKQNDKYRIFVPYVDNMVLDVTGAHSNGDTRVLR